MQSMTSAVKLKKKTSKVFEFTVNKKPRGNLSRVNDIYTHTRL